MPGSMLHRMGPLSLEDSRTLGSLHLEYTLLR